MITLITGGARSGKSSFAEQIVLEACKSPIYLATSTIYDDEMRLRVQRHQERRGSEWTTIEEPLFLSKHNFKGHTVLLDCVTLWVTNVFFHFEEDIEKALDFVKTEFSKIAKQKADFYIVTNEIGMGGVSENAMARRFTDLQGWVNQHIAEHADSVWFLVSGIPINIKSDITKTT